MTRWTVLLTLLIPSAAIADTWTLTDASLSPTAVENVVIDASTLSASLGGQNKSVAIDQFVSLTGGETSPIPTDAFVLHTVWGERFVGKPVSSTAEAVTFHSLSAGDRTVPLTDVVSIDRSIDAPSSERPQEDVATLTNRDVVKGIVSAINGETLTISINGADTPVALNNVASVRLAATGEPSAKPTPAYRVSLVDGTVLNVNDLRADATGWTLTSAGGPLTLASAQVVRVDHVAGPVVWLSSLPAQIQYTPYLGESFPPVTDATVTHTPIVVADRTYDRGIGVHAKTVLKYTLDGSRPTFCTRYATEASMPLADVLVRIRVDDKVVHEARVRGGALSPVVWADISGAKTLSLEVDFGSGLHTQDRLNFVQPALTNQPVPTTVPAN